MLLFLHAHKYGSHTDLFQSGFLFRFRSPATPDLTLELKIAGDRTFEPWTITVINDPEMKVRNSFETWLNGINEHVNNTGLANPSDYQADMTVEQLGKDGAVTKTYTIRGGFPTTVSSIDLSYDTNDAIEEYTVEISYQYWESNTTT